MFPEAEPRETLRFSGNKINCFPRDQSLSVYCRLIFETRPACWQGQQCGKRPVRRRERNIVNFKLDRAIKCDVTHLSRVWDKKKI